MSVAEAVSALQLSNSPNAAARTAAIVKLHQLRRTDPATLRAAAQQLGAAAFSVSSAAGWSNWIGEQTATPKAVHAPTRVPDLRKLVNKALADGDRMKANATGHSTSAVARPNDGALGFNLRNLNSKLTRKFEKTNLPAYAKGAGTDLFRVQAGVTINALSQKLLADGLALPNSGTFDGQQIIGALATGTHGSGAQFTTLADIVMSLEMLVVEDTPSGPKQRRLRIERSNGITDPAKWPRRRGRLVQNDDVFNAVVVSFGTMGIVTELTLKVVTKFWLEETREFMLWSALKPMLTNISQSADHVDIHINPYRKNGDHSCVIIRRQRKPWQNQPVTDRPEDQEFIRFFARNFGTDLLGWFASQFPSFVADGIDRYCEEPGTFFSASYKVLITGYGHDIEATSSEFCTSIAEAPTMVQAILDTAHAHRDKPAAQRIRHSSPLGLRFVKGSDQFISQHQGGLNATVEIPFVMGTTNRDWALSKYEDVLRTHGQISKMRPHWGQKTTITASRAAGVYETNWTKWLAQYDVFNATGFFNNRFTAQLGIDR